MSTALDILEAVADRCRYITVGNGFNTNAGLSVLREHRRFNDDEVSDAGAISVFDIEDSPEEQDRFLDQMMIDAQISIIGAIDGGSEPTTRAHHLLADIKRAVLPERQLGGLTLDLGYAGRRIEYPEPGQTTVIVAVSITAMYRETRGLP